MVRLGGGGLPAPCSGGWPVPLGGPASCACAENASKDMAETTGMMIFMRLDALIGVYPLTFRNGRGAMRDRRVGSYSADVADIIDLRGPSVSRYKCLRSRQIFVRTNAEPGLASRLDHIAIASPRHQAILHLAGGGEVPSKPQADRQEHGSNDEPRDRAATVVAGSGLRRSFGFLCGIRHGVRLAGLGHGDRVAR